METKYYISTIEDSEVKAYCIMSNEGLVMECKQMRDDKQFYADVERLCEYYNCIKIQDVPKERQSRVYGSIPSITVKISDYFKTDEGKKDVWNYVNSVGGFDYDLINEIANFPQK